MHTQIYFVTTFYSPTGTLHSVFYYDGGLSIVELQMLAGVDTSLRVYPNCVCPPSHPFIDPSNELMCSDNRAQRLQRISANAHGAEFLNDRNDSTWWQSANDVIDVNVTIDLDHLREVYLVAIHFVSILPQAAIILYSQDGVNFTPRQYFAQDCKVSFDMTNNAPLTSPTDVNCLHAFSVPLSDRYLEFRLLDTISRPGIADIDNNQTLKNFSLATHVRLVLMGWYSQQMLTGHRYFAISEVFISGRACTCNGHANVCDGSSCRCQHNTTGPNCEECLPPFNNRPWLAGNSTAANECQKCPCNGHSESCEYQDTTGMGICINCTHNTIGDLCEQCMPMFYNPDDVPFNSPDACQPCGCDPNGVNNSLLCEDGTGNCVCKSLVTGRRCNACRDGFFNLTADNPDGCVACICNASGTVPNSVGCEISSGQCPCLPNVGAPDCSQCLPRHYGFGDPSGCQPCDEQCSDDGCSGPQPTNCEVRRMSIIHVIPRVDNG